MGRPPPLLPPASSASRGASQAHRPGPMAGLWGALRAGLRPTCPHNPAGGCPVSRTWRWDVTELTQAWGEEGKFGSKHTSVRSGVRWQGRGTGGGRGPRPGVSVPCASHAGCGRLGGACGRAEGGRSAEPNAGSPGRAEGCAARRTRCSAPAPASSAVPGRAWESHTLCCTSRPCPQGGDRPAAERRAEVSGAVRFAPGSVSELGHSLALDTALGLGGAAACPCWLGNKSPRLCPGGDSGKHTGPEDQEDQEPFYCETALSKARARARGPCVPTGPSPGNSGWDAPHTSAPGGGAERRARAGCAAVAEAEPARQSGQRRQTPNFMGAVFFLRV